MISLEQVYNLSHQFVSQCKHGIIDADLGHGISRVVMTFLTSALTVLQNEAEQYKPKQTFEDA